VPSGGEAVPDAGATPASAGSAGSAAEPLLTVRDLSVAYGSIVAVRDVTLEVRSGEIVAVLGPNGAGKSTLLKTIAGVLAPARGEIVFDGRRIDGAPAEEVVRRGLALVPEGRMVFPRLTVEENLRIGAYARTDRDAVAATLERVLEMFPVLAARGRQAAGTLSGGEQQQLAIARAMMSEPALLLLDEPSLGLAPIVVDLVFELIVELRRRGTTILLVEQNVHRALEIANRGAVLAVGKVVLSGTAAELRATEGRLQRAYLGIGAG
jgi:branched-chain amino acid transport system ATP-binding protein